VTTTTTKKPKTGGEIDAYCTKCRLDLTHRIIAMVGDAVKKVECKTCGSHHQYRRPKTERDAALARLEKKAADRKAAAASGGSSASTGGGSKAARAERAERLEREQTSAWEHAIAGQPTTAFKPYRISVTFGAGELVRHPKFGDGVVQKVIDAGKVEILFKDGPRTMAQGQT
jgi:Zn ribbon nucleic-acid-binding protein